MRVDDVARPFPVAERVAAERGESIGGTVGYTIRLESKARGVIENKHSTNVEYTPPPPYTLCVCMSIHTEG